MEEQLSPVKKHKVMVYVVAFTAALAGLLFGLDIGVISGALPFIEKQFQCTTQTSEWIVSSLLGGAVLGTFMSGPISLKYGRKPALLISAVIFALGAILSAVATSAIILIIVRFFLGIAVGIASFTAPLYLSEMAPQRIRGALISMYQLMITIGIVMAFLSDTALSYGGHWRWMLGILVIPSSFMFIGILFLPQSPRWLALVGRKAEAKDVLKKLRETEKEVLNELNEIDKTLETKQSGFSLLGNSNYKRVLVLGIGLQIMQQLTGINIMMYYAPKIFKIAGFATTQEQMFGTVLIGVINVLATFIAIAFVDKFGRKPMLILGFIIMGISLAMVGTSLGILDYDLQHHNAVPVYHGVVHLKDAILPTLATHSATIKYIAIAFLLIFIIGFAMSAGPIMWVICSEIYPLAGRDLGITCSTASNWFTNMIVGATFLTLLNDFGHAQTFWLFGGLNLLFIFFTVKFIPETKGISLEEIEENLMSGKKLVDIGKRPVTE